MTAPDLPRATWRKSTYSNNGGACVEIAALDAAAWCKSTRSGGQRRCLRGDHGRQPRHRRP
jgi:Domain of unknown function (DUF397)